MLDITMHHLLKHDSDIFILFLSHSGIDVPKCLFRPLSESGGLVAIIPWMFLGRTWSLIFVWPGCRVASFEFLHDLSKSIVMGTRKAPWSVVKEGS